MKIKSAKNGYHSTQRTIYGRIPASEFYGFVLGIAVGYIVPAVINLTGHKDEQICRYAAEALCRKYQAVVTCTGGFHVDGISSGQIEELMGKLEEIFS